MTDPIEVRDRRHPSESSLLDQETLDPKFHYRFIQERPTSVARAKLKGYRVVKTDEDKVKTVYDQEDETPQNIIKHGDRILMKVPKAKHKSNRKEVSDQANQRLLSANQKVRQKAREMGLQLHEVDEEDED
jgi:hypothetical protein